MVLPFLHHPSCTQSILLFISEQLRKLKMPAQGKEFPRSQHNVPTECGITQPAPTLTYLELPTRKCAPSAPALCPRRPAGPLLDSVCTC